MNRRTLGVMATIVSAVFFGLVPLFVTTIKAGGGNALSVAFYRFALSLPALYLMVRREKISLAITGRQLLRIAVVTIFGYGGTAILLFTSYNYIPTGMTTTIHFVYPVFTILGSIIFFREKIVAKKILCVALSMGGILLFYNGEGGDSLLGMGLAFLSGITYAFYILFLGKTDLQEIPTFKLIFHMNWVAAVMFFITSVATGDFTLDLTGKAWAVAWIFATFTSLIGVYGFQLGVKYIGSESSAILSTFEPITSMAVGILLYNESFSLRGIAGAVCILISTIIVARMKE